MRWIFTMKHDQSAKARLVIIGFQDPDLTSLATTAPVMSRRTRGLFFILCSCKKWTALKADVRAAFLQGLDSEEERQVFVKPVVELSQQLGGDEKSIAQIVKACYGLVNAPAQWYASVADTMAKAGFTRLHTDPCAWRVTDDDGQVIGAACAHVDDFLFFAGEASHPKWQAALSYLYKAFSWSDWEADSYQHCGVQVIQHPSGHAVLNHSEYCTSIEQIRLSPNQDEKDKVTDEQHPQLRAVLGALQWRVYQSAPQHGARLSLLQGQLSSPSVSTIRETNKLVREVYNGRHVGLHYHDLNVDDLEDVIFVSWCDAAVGNRKCLSSTGGRLFHRSSRASHTAGRVKLPESH